MRNLLKLAALGCLAVSYLATPAIAEPAKVAIGYPPATDFLAVYVAKEKGIFAKHNIDATPTKLPVVTNIPSAVVSGSIQIGMTTVPVLLQAVDGGLDFVLIAGAAHHTKASPFISLIARKDVKIEKPADIVGKKVGVPGINSVIDVMFRKWLTNNKVPVDQVKIIEAPLPQLPDLLKGGTLDPMIEKDLALGRIYNVNQTPTTIIHFKGQTYPVVGIVSYDVLHQFLDQLLSQR